VEASLSRADRGQRPAVFNRMQRRIGPDVRGDQLLVLADTVLTLALAAAGTVIDLGLSLLLDGSPFGRPRGHTSLATTTSNPPIRPRPHRQ